MHSLRTKFTFMMVCVVIFAILATTLMTVFFIQSNEQKKADQLLLLLCETGEKNLDYYFNSVQKSVEKVATFVESDLDGTDDVKLGQHMERVFKYFDEMAAKTNGVLTYYYRVDPEVSKTVKGFWYVDLDGEGFTEHEVTDITQYDTSDTSKLVWFTVPKYEGKSIWLPPYITDNLDKRVISYNTPIYWRGQFVGVVGIEIDYSTMAEQVNSIRLYNSGCAYLSSADGELFYHPKIDITQLTAKTMPQTPEGVLSESTFFKYTYDGVEKVAAWLPLSNGMRLNVAVPVSEAEGGWQDLIINIVLVAAAVLAVSITFTMIYTKRVTLPIKQLTEAADRVDNGDYDVTLEYEKDDELGRLTKTFKLLAGHMKEHITSLNKQVFTDSLTNVKNMGAYKAATEELQAQISSGEPVKFAIGIFDCDNLKHINDQNGHDKGNAYIKAACSTICRTFHHSPVFRIGGDEFAVILKNDDYQNMEVLSERFWETADKINSSKENIWDQVHISMGIAVYDPGSDTFVSDVERRADKNMYENKRIRKKLAGDIQKDDKTDHGDRNESSEDKRKNK